MTDADVMSVYSGKGGKCCCGCSGIHRYHPAHVAVAAKDRGYAIDPKQVNIGQVRRVLRTIQENVAEAEFGTNYVSWVDYDHSEKGKLYIVYPLVVPSPGGLEEEKMTIEEEKMTMELGVAFAMAAMLSSEERVTKEEHLSRLGNMTAEEVGE